MVGIVSVMMFSTSLVGTAAANNNEYPFHVIGAGHGRTGTDSLRMALNQLGLGKTHHMREVFQTLSYEDWIDVALETDPKRRVKLVRDIMVNGNYHSSVDYPSAHFYEALMEAFPKAKVILTVRDSPEAWVHSALNSIFTSMICQRTSVFENGRYFVCPGLNVVYTLVPVFHSFVRMAGLLVAPEAGDLSHDHLVRSYKERIANVTRVVPADRLLVFNAKQGWDPLVKFLGVPKPTGPFPKSNDTKEFQQRMLYLAIAGYLLLIFIVFVIFMIVYGVRRYVMGKTTGKGGGKKND